MANERARQVMAVERETTQAQGRENMDIACPSVCLACGSLASLKPPPPSPLALASPATSLPLLFHVVSPRWFLVRITTSRLTLLFHQQTHSQRPSRGPSPVLLQVVRCESGILPLGRAFRITKGAYCLEERGEVEGNEGGKANRRERDLHPRGGRRRVRPSRVESFQPPSAIVALVSRAHS